MTEKVRQKGERPSAHELFTPLNHIIGYSELLEEQANKQGRGDAVRRLRVIANAGRRLKSLLSETFEPIPAMDAPLLDADAAAVSAYDMQSTPPLNGRLLVVDDDADNREVLTERLTARGFTVVLATNGAEALDAVSASEFDIVLLDIMMPGVDGLEVLRNVRRTQSVADLPIIMVTSRDSSADVVEALRLGANDYVMKPIDLGVALARINTQLSLKRANDLVRDLNRQLNEATAKIASLQDSSSEAMRNIPEWASRVADDLAPMVHARAIAVYIEKEGALQPIREGSPEAPSADEARAALASRGLRRSTGDDVIGVAGLAGALFGAFVVEGKEGPWADPERQLLATFARQLGSALELQRIRGELDEEKQRRIDRRKVLIDRGVALLGLCPRCGRCFTDPVKQCQVDEAELDDRLLPVEIQGRYRLMRLLGSGGMGEVFRARDLRLVREVAVKVIRADQFNNSTVRLRFEREARALASIAHEGVVTIYDSGELEDGSGFLVTELLIGWDLRSILKLHGPGAPAQISELVRQTGLGLGSAHQAGLIHRDIKPANLFLTVREPFFQVKLLDFGVSKPIDLDPELTQRGMLVGTPAYMAPEVVNGSPVDIRSDVYSLGAVAYESLTGRAVTTKEGQGIWFDIMYGEPPAVSALFPCATAEVDELFRRVLAKDPAARPSIASLIDEIALLNRLESDRRGWPSDLFVDEREVSDEALSNTEVSVTAADVSTMRAERPRGL